MLVMVFLMQLQSVLLFIEALGLIALTDLVVLCDFISWKTCLCHFG